MKPLSYAFLAAAAACGLASAAETAYTTPVGYISLSIGGNVGDAVPGNSDVAVSLPLDRSVEFAGVVSSVSGSDVTVTGASFGTLSDPAVPHVATIGSGAKNGLSGLITANTATTVTISVPPGDSLSGVVLGDTISIHKAWTPSSVFSTAPPAGTQILAFSGAAAGINIGVDLIYEFDGTNWIDTNTFDLADNTVLYQGEGFLVRNQSASPISSIVVSGSVPVANSRMVLSNLAVGVGQDNVVGYIGAVGEVIGTSGLSSIATAGDQLLGLDNSSSGQNKGYSTIIEFDGSSWIDTNTFDDVTATFKIESGVGYTYRRSASAPAGDVIWSDQPDYVPSL